MGETVNAGADLVRQGPMGALCLRSCVAYAALAALRRKWPTTSPRC